MPDTAKIRALNDTVRTSLTGCRVMITQGVRALDLIDEVLAAVIAFDEFTEDNDPHHEHDFGSFHIDRQTVFWKFDNYDRVMVAGSEDPSDPAVTTRVLTIMLAEEY